MDLKMEINRVQTRYIKKDDVMNKRQHFLGHKYAFSTKLFNMKLKGEKLQLMANKTNQVIRDLNGMNSVKDKDEFVSRMVVYSKLLDDKIN